MNGTFALFLYLNYKNKLSKLKKCQKNVLFANRKLKLITVK